MEYRVTSKKSNIKLLVPIGALLFAGCFASWGWFLFILLLIAVPTALYAFSMGWSTILVINEEGVSYHSGNLAAVFKNIKEDDVSNHSSSLVADFKWNEIKEIRYYVDGGTHNLDITLHSGKLCTLFLGSLEFDFLSWRLVRKIQSFSHNSEIIKYKKRHLYGLR